ncbi:hypothetical protein [Romboutsia sp.]|uniref:hypothetical protein n=1 Tax=Romboutsia sp. TaxID=1965302 RepID=UPI002C462160|nr:hypothetical protein [Romboutsia sp.]HSQ88256.1 hypothetical protein [Romboutsia sp.]
MIGKFAYVANSDSNTVSVIDTSSNAVVDNIGVGIKAFQIAIANVSGSILY